MRFQTTIHRHCVTGLMIAAVLSTAVAQAGTPIQQQIPRKKASRPIQSQFFPTQQNVRRQTRSAAERPDRRTRSLESTQPVARPPISRRVPVTRFVPRRVAPPVVRHTNTTPEAIRIAPIRYGNSIVTFDNESGEPALVRLVGPTRAEVTVPNGTENSIHRVAAGSYVIHVRYGTFGHYRYTRGDRFEVTEKVTESALIYSRIRITLHLVLNGNYGSHDSTAETFAAAAPRSQ